MPTTFCTYCGRLVGFDPANVVPLRDRDGEFGPQPPGVAVHAFLDCGHEKNLVTVLAAEEVAA